MIATQALTLSSFMCDDSWSAHELTPLTTERAHLFAQPASNPRPALFTQREECEKVEIPSLNSMQAPVSVNAKQVSTILRLREKRAKALKKRGLALNSETVRLLTSPDRKAKKQGHVKRARAMKRVEGRFLPLF